MRRWITLIENSIPETQYGYWITDRGEFIPVDHEEHDWVARENGTTSGYALEDGWIRIACKYTNTLNIHFQAGRLGARAISALGRLVRSQDYLCFYVDTDDQIIIGGRINTVSALMNLVSRCSKTAMAQPALVEGAKPTLYLRFGEIPKDERSGIGASPNWIHARFRTSDIEEGVSCYWTHWDAALGQWVLDDYGNPASVSELIAQADEGHRNIYIVTGDELDHTGTDGEPLLRNVRIISRVDSIREILAPGVHDGKEMDRVIRFDMDEMLIFYPDGSTKQETDSNITDAALDEWLGWTVSFNGMEITFEGSPALLFRQFDGALPLNDRATRWVREMFGPNSPAVHGTMVVMKNPRKKTVHV